MVVNRGLVNVRIYLRTVYLVYDTFAHVKLIK